MPSLPSPSQSPTTGSESLAPNWKTPAFAGPAEAPNRSDQVAVFGSKTPMSSRPSPFQSPDHRDRALRAELEDAGVGEAAGRAVAERPRRGLGVERADVVDLVAVPVADHGDRGPRRSGRTGRRPRRTRPGEAVERSAQVAVSSVKVPTPAFGVMRSSRDSTDRRAARSARVLREHSAPRTRSGGILTAGDRVPAGASRRRGGRGGVRDMQKSFPSRPSARVGASDRPWRGDDTVESNAAILRCVRRSDRPSRTGEDGELRPPEP